MSDACPPGRLISHDGARLSLRRTRWSVAVSPDTAAANHSGSNVDLGCRVSPLPEQRCECPAGRGSIARVVAAMIRSRSAGTLVESSTTARAKAATARACASGKSRRGPLSNSAAPSPAHASGLWGATCTKCSAAAMTSRRVLGAGKRGPKVAVRLPRSWAESRLRYLQATCSAAFSTSGHQLMLSRRRAASEKVESAVSAA